jgi:hypothetical protein
MTSGRSCLAELYPNPIGSFADFVLADSGGTARVRTDGSERFNDQPRPSFAKLRFDVLAAVKHSQNLYVLTLDGIDNDVFPDRKAAQAGAQIATGTAHARILSEQVEALCNGVDDAISPATLPLSLTI